MPTPITPAWLVARAEAEARHKQRKLAREARLRSKAAVDVAVQDALARAARPRAERLRAALGNTFDRDAFVGDLAAWAVPLRELARVDAKDYRAVADVVCAIEARAPRLVLTPLGEWDSLGTAVVRLASLHQRFVRPLSSWTPPARQPARVWQSLVAHVFHRFKTPAALDVVFTDRGRPECLASVVADVGAGTSWRALDLPTWMTRAVAHALSTPTSCTGAMELVRDAQARASGLSPAHRTVVGRHARSEGLTWFLPDDSALEGLFSFFSRHPEMPAADVDVVCRAIGTLVTSREPVPAMKGRTPRSLVALANDLIRAHRLRTDGAVDVGPFPPSPIGGGAYVLLQDPTFDDATFLVEPVTTGRALVEEGLAMRHCVGTYAELCKRGDVVIVGIRRSVQGRVRRAVTVEVRTATRTIVQVRGRANRTASVEEQGVIACWAREQGLLVGAHAIG